MNTNYEISVNYETSLIDKYYDEWDNAPEKICPACKGTGLDKYEEFDCEACFGEGALPPVLGDLSDLTGVQR